MILYCVRDRENSQNPIFHFFSKSRIEFQGRRKPPHKRLLYSQGLVFKTNKQHWDPDEADNSENDARYAGAVQVIQGLSLQPNLDRIR